MARALPEALPRALVVTPRARAAAERHRLGVGPGEAVGILVGRALGRRRSSVAVASRFLPLTNAAPDPARHFRIEAADLARALAHAARRGQAALAVLHSHGAGPARASAPDVAGAWPELLTVVAGGSGGWRAFALRLKGGRRALVTVPLVLGLARRGSAWADAARPRRRAEAP